MTQRQIDAAHRKSLKRSYRYLSKPETRLVKIDDRVRELQLWKRKAWAAVYFRDSPPFTPETTSKQSLDDLEVIVSHNNELERLFRRRERLIEAQKWSDTDVDRIKLVYLQVNIAPGGSY